MARQPNRIALDSARYRPAIVGAIVSASVRESKPGRNITVPREAPDFHQGGSGTVEHELRARAGLVALDQAPPSHGRATRRPFHASEPIDGGAGLTARIHAAAGAVLPVIDAARGRAATLDQPRVRRTTVAVPVQRRGEAQPNRTGIPDRLKDGVEQLAGVDLGDVRVRYNSSKPAKRDAHAYTQGTRIELAPGREQNPPHEAWHVVQQTLGRVRPTMRAHGESINDDVALEREATKMGSRALQLRQAENAGGRRSTLTPATDVGALQRFVNPLLLDDLIGTDAVKGSLRTIVDRYNDREGSLREDFYGHKSFSKSYLDEQKSDLTQMATAIDNALASEDEQEYNKNILRALKGNVEIDREQFGLDTGSNGYKIEQGLIKGSYNREENIADLHVRAKDEGGGFPVDDMSAVAKRLYQTMTLRELDDGPDGFIVLRPTGAAIVKIVVQILGEAFGDADLVKKARRSIARRKFKEGLIEKFKKLPERDPHKLDTAVHEEHFRYLKSLIGATGVDIRPIMRGAKSLKEYNQNMLELSAQGTDRFEAYMKTVERHEVGVSLMLHIQRDRLPAVISLLQAGPREM